jgi:hypothetical protein
MNKKIIVGILIILVLMPVALPTLNQRTNALNVPKSISTLLKETSQNDVQVTCYTIGKSGMRHATVIIPIHTAMICYAAFHQLLDNITSRSYSGNTQGLKHEFITLLVENNLLPSSIPPDQYDTLLNPPWIEKLQKNHHTPSYTPTPEPTPTAGAAAAFVCSIGGEGNGVLFPFLMLPRPRLITTWAALDGATTVGKFLTYGGFAAGGAQFGTALGFWGIGFAFAFPYGTIYGFVGYALFAAVTAQYIERYPPNHAPIIIGTQPVNLEQNVPVSLSELQFSIEDPDGDLMSYSVTTTPDIGSGNGKLKTAGTYTVPVHDLQEITQYSWTLTVSDNELATEQTSTFITQAISPVVSNPLPADGERHVSTDLQTLQFTLKDYQGDMMDYTVATSPFIGSGSGTDVHNGTYSIPVSGLLNFTTYHWYVNATDGTHWTRKIFAFQTGFPTHFDPFIYGWHYRKQITIDHTNIPADLINFPVLISIVDDDLKEKAQPNGNDILFMNNTGFATVLYYEIEEYDSTQGALTAWVNLTQLSSDQDTMFYMYYGNPTTLSQQVPEKTWDLSYLAVWHMNDATLSTISDSTINQYTGTKSSANEPNEEQGRVGKSQHFDGTNDYIQFVNKIIPTGSKTISAWVKKERTGWQQVFANSQGDGSPNAGTAWCFDDTSGGIIEFDLGNAGQPDHYIKVRIPVTDFEWHYYTMVFDNNGPCLYGYKDGSLIVLSTTTSGDEAPPNYNLRMGRSNDGNSPYYMKGGLDEVRVSNAVENAQWISVEYMNQNNPAGFYTIGPEVPGP